MNAACCSEKNHTITFARDNYKFQFSLQVLYCELSMGSHGILKRCVPECLDLIKVIIRAAPVRILPVTPVPCLCVFWAPWRDEHNDYWCHSFDLQLNPRTHPGACRVSVTMEIGLLSAPQTAQAVLCRAPKQDELFGGSLDPCSLRQTLLVTTCTQI